MFLKSKRKERKTIFSVLFVPTNNAIRPLYFKCPLYCISLVLLYNNNTYIFDCYSTLYTAKCVYCYLYTLYLYIMDMKRKVMGLGLTLLYIIYRWLAHSKNLMHVLWCLICWYHLTVGLIQEATVAGRCPDEMLAVLYIPPGWTTCSM